MIIKDNKFSKDKVFFAEEIIFDYSNDKISQNEIDEIDDFPGKEDFVHFYSIYNGGGVYRWCMVFSRGLL